MKNRKMLYFTVILFASLFALWGVPQEGGGDFRAGSATACGSEG